MEPPGGLVAYAGEIDAVSYTHLKMLKLNKSVPLNNFKVLI